MPVLQELRADRAVELVLVDDGSRDSTYSDLLKKFPSTADVPVKVLRHQNNLGLSSALRSAANVVTGDVVCTLDADCTYDPSNIAGMLATLEQSGADVVTASPYHPDGGVEKVQGWRLAMSRGASRLYAALVPQKLYCYTSMFRVYRREWYRPALISKEQFTGVTEILVRSILEGATVAEYPVVLRRRAHGESKMKVGRATWGHLRLMGSLLVGSKFHLPRSLS